MKDETGCFLSASTIWLWSLPLTSCVTRIVRIAVLQAMIDASAKRTRRLTLCEVARNNPVLSGCVETAGCVETENISLLERFCVRENQAVIFSHCQTPNPEEQLFIEGRGHLVFLFTWVPKVDGQVRRQMGNSWYHMRPIAIIVDAGNHILQVPHGRNILRPDRVRATEISPVFVDNTVLKHVALAKCSTESTLCETH